MTSAPYLNVDARIQPVVAVASSVPGKDAILTGGEEGGIFPP